MITSHGAVCAGRYTLLEQGALNGLLPAATGHGVSIVAAAAFNSGILARDRRSTEATYNYGPVPQDVLTRVNAVADVCGIPSRPIFSTSRDPRSRRTAGRRRASAGHLNHWYCSGEPCAQHGQRTDSGCSLPFQARTDGMTGFEPWSLPQVRGTTELRFIPLTRRRPPRRSDFL